MKAVTRIRAELACACVAFAASASAQAAGAVTSFTSYEAEAGVLSGGAKVVALTAAPTTRFASPELEASGHAYVALTGVGQEVAWTNTTGKPITFVNVRASIPDAPAGGGITATLDLYVDGKFRQHLAFNSRQTWIYEGLNYQASDQDPSHGDPRAFFDESHAFVSGKPIAPGATFSLRVGKKNTAAFYDVDVIDVEQPPAALQQPAGSISITSCGAVADDVPTNGSGDPAAVDSTAAIQACIGQAQSQHKVLWIPPGTFYLKGTAGLVASGIDIEGAGLWYSTIYRDVPLPNATPLGALFQLTSTTLRNLHLDANETSREMVDGAGGAMDVTGTNWLSENLWTQHVLSGCWASGTGGTVRNSRFTAIWADGCNLNNVSMGATVGNGLTATNNFVRGTGDDAMAINSVAYNDTSSGRVFYTAMSNITETNNTLLCAWNGKGLGVYGGTGHLVANNLVADTARYTGLGVGRFGVNGSDLHASTITGNRILRAGGNGFDQGQPALHVGNGSDGQGVGVVDQNEVSGNVIVGALYDAIGFSSSTNTHLHDNTVVAPWRNAIVINAPFYPATSGSADIVANTASGLAGGKSAFIDYAGGFATAPSGNSWQLGTPEAPYLGSPAAVPGTVQAANYDTGGLAVAWQALSTNGTDNAYRADGIDLEASADKSGGVDLGWTQSGQWFRYTVDVAAAGPYKLRLRVASPTGAAHALHLSDASGRSLSGDIDVPATGDWQAWAWVAATVVLPAGRQVLTLNQDAGGWNLHQLAFAAVQ